MITRFIQLSDARISAPETDIQICCLIGEELNQGRRLPTGTAGMAG